MRENLITIWDFLCNQFYDCMDCPLINADCDCVRYKTNMSDEELCGYLARLADKLID